MIIRHFEQSQFNTRAVSMRSTPSTKSTHLAEFKIGHGNHSRLPKTISVESLRF